MKETRYNTYLIERTDEIGYDEVDSMVVIAESPMRAMDLALQQSWGDWNIYKKRELLKAKEIRLDKEQVVLISTKDG